MKAKINHEESWLKQQCYDLENGWMATVEYGVYGDFVCRLDNPDRSFYWHCSSGIDTLPEFARPWLRGGGWFITENLVDPKFEIVHPESYLE